MTSTGSARVPTDATRKATRAAGIFYIATFVFSIPALGLYEGVVNDPDFVLGAGSGGGVAWGGLLEILTALTCIGAAVAIYPVLRRYGPGRAAGFVASRTLEAATIFTGVIAVLAVSTLRQDLAGGDPVALTTVAAGLVAVKKWTFLLGPGVMASVNALCFATVLYQFRLVPRWIPTLGLIGAPILFFSSTVTLFGGWDQVSSQGLVSALPIAVWEVSVGTYMLLKGFRTAAPPHVEPTSSTAPAALVNAVIR